VETVRNFVFLGSKITADGDCSHEIKIRLLLGRKTMTTLDRLKKQRHYFTDKGPYTQSYGFSSSHVWMWELDHKESWVLKNWCFWTVVLEKTLESPLYCKEIHPVILLIGLLLLLLLFLTQEGDKFIVSHRELLLKVSLSHCNPAGWTQQYCRKHFISFYIHLFNDLKDMKYCHFP